MSHYDWLLARFICISDPPFYSLIQAAMRMADSDNLERLRAAWPDVWEELQARYVAPGGILPSDPIYQPTEEVPRGSPG